MKKKQSHVIFFCQINLFSLSLRGSGKQFGSTGQEEGPLSSGPQRNTKFQKKWKDRTVCPFYRSAKLLTADDFSAVVIDSNSFFILVSHMNLLTDTRQLMRILTTRFIILQQGWPSSFGAMGDFAVVWNGGPRENGWGTACLRLTVWRPFTLLES